MRVRWFALISYLLLELITANTFAKNTQKQHHQQDPKTGWSGWATLGGGDFLSESDPAACSLSNSGVFIAARGVDNQVHTRYWNGTSWTGWSLNGGATDASPALACQDKYIYLFYRGTDGGLWGATLTASCGEVSIL